MLPTDLSGGICMMMPVTLTQGLPRIQPSTIRRFSSPETGDVGLNRMKIMDGSSWLKAFEPFYGPEYCQGVIMELEKLKDELYSRSNFRFHEGWLKPTLELLQRLKAMGLPVRTEKYIFIHLVTPIETMGFGELYFQVGRKLPGRLSLKFTRKNTDGSIVIQPTVLREDEEHHLATNPVGYMQQLMNSGRSVDQMLQQIVVLTDNYIRERVDVLPFLQQFTVNAFADFQRRDSSGVWQYHSSPAQQFMHINNSSFNMAPIISRSSIPHSTLMRNSGVAIGRTRSGSEGALLTQGAGINEKMLRTCRLSTHEPEENDETDSPCEPEVKPSQMQKIPGEADHLAKSQKIAHPSEVQRCSSPVRPGRKSQETAANFKTTTTRNDIRHRQSSFSTDEYTHTTQGLNQQGGMRSGSDGTGSQSSLRTDVKDEYAGVTEAMGSLHLSQTVGNDPPSLNTKIEQWRLRNAGATIGVNGAPRLCPVDVGYPNLPQAWPEATSWNKTTAAKFETSHCQPQRYTIQEDYIGTEEGIIGEIPSLTQQQSWVSHRDSEPQAIFRQSQIDFRGMPYQCTGAPRSVLLPLSVEELNRESDQRNKYSFAEQR